MDAIKGVFNWPFLQEPAWRWAIFVGLILVILVLWHFVLAHMKAASV